jgi:hypothetical protein
MQRCNIRHRAGSYSGSYAYVTRDSQNSGSPGGTLTLPENLGPAVPTFFILGLIAQNDTATAVRFNGTPLTKYPDNRAGVNIWAGTATPLGTGLDQVEIDAPAWAYDNADLYVYSASGLVSTTPVYNQSTGVVSSVSSACAAGNFVFALAGGIGSLGNFTGSAQAPAHTYTEPGNYSAMSDWTANSTGCSGGTFTATYSQATDPIIAIWH